LLASPDTALRLLVAHALASSGNWNVKADPQRTRSEEIRASIEQSPAQAAFDTERAAIETLLALPENDRDGDDARTGRVFARLLALSDADVQRIAAFVMAETLAAGSTAVETVGAVLKVDSSSHWQPDSTFFDLIRERATINAMVAEVAGKDVAKGNLAEKTATQKQIVRDSLEGRNGRTKVEHWLPGWMAFPFKSYGNGASRIAAISADVRGLFRRK
jgi:ParB family chromosome partitioning protein